MWGKEGRKERGESLEVGWVNGGKLEERWEVKKEGSWKSKGGKSVKKSRDRNGKRRDRTGGWKLGM